MDKKKMMELLKEKSVIIVGAGLLVSILLTIFGGALSGIGVIGIIGFGIYASSVSTKIAKKKKLEEEQKQIEKEENKKLAEEKEKDEKKAQLEATVKEFCDSINVDDELNHILSVLEKSSINAANFEKGVAQLVKKGGASIPQEAVLPVLKKALFDRAFANNDCPTAKVVVIDYFIRDIIQAGLFTKYVPFVVSRESGSSAAAMTMEVPFIKTLFGIAGRAMNYRMKGLSKENYQTLTSEDFIAIIEDSDALKSYTDKDPFTVDEVRKSWANDIYNAPLELIKSGKLSDMLENEKYVDEAFYITYVAICKDLKEDPEEAVSVYKITSVYLNYLKEYHNSINTK